jgi:hypothetical protein
LIGDPGMNYATSTPLSYEGVTYPGIKISYNAGIGISSEDEYFLHYNPDTYNMEWLGYTVTYFSGKKSDAVKWIRYTEWQKNNSFLLPTELTWYNTEEGKPISPRSARKFENIVLSKEAKTNEFYAMIEGAKFGGIGDHPQSAIFRKHYRRLDLRSNSLACNQQYGKIVLF